MQILNLKVIAMSEKKFYIFGDNIRGNFGEVDKPLNNTEIVDLLNEQDEKIKVLQNSCEIMNRRLSEKNKCDYKKAIIEFCKFINIETPLLDVMVDEFLQEVF